MKTLWFSRFGKWSDRNIVDFDLFHLIAQNVWLGSVNQAYHFVDLLRLQREASGGHGAFMPWTYPPQFSLLLAPFGLFPLGVAYPLFVTATFTFYALVLRAVAGRNYLLLLIVFFPAMEVTMACGQNGFLTAGLLGLVCLYFEERPIVAGLALGLMVIKPHLAIAFATYAILKRSWSVVAAAAAVVLTSSVVCTLVFGVQIWADFLQSVHDSSSFLQRGFYPLFRMISVYAALRTAGLAAWVAFLGQIVVAIFALGLVAFSVFRRWPLRTGLGLTAAVSVCISPYAYDYDFLIFGMGLAMLVPQLQKVASERERSMIYAAPMLIGAYGNLRSSMLPDTYDGTYVDLFSPAGFVLIPLLVLIVLPLLRVGEKRAVPSLAAETAVS
jgi:hypothetical protein